MPISKQTFDSGDTFSNPNLLDFFVKNRSNAYALKELQQKFGLDVTWGLMVLLIGGQLEQKYLRNDYYYQLKPKK